MPFPGRSEADWRKAAEAALKGGAFETLVSVTPDGIALGPIQAGRSGPRAWRGEAGPWKALTRLDHPSPDDFNAAAREDLDSGAEGLAIVFARSGAAYGFGLKASDPASLSRAFAGLTWEHGRFNLDIADFAEAEAVAAFVERFGAADVSFGLDPLGLCARGAPAPGAAAFKATADGLRRRGFRGPFAAADARGIHDAGGTPAQELAFALAAGVAYLRILEHPDAIEFRLAADADQFTTLAKFRAMRLLWRRVEQECGLTPAPIRLAASSAWRMMTVAEPFVNVMRAALAAFAAGLGGADSVTLLPFSQAIGLPDAFARRLARNTQLVELREARLGFVADPAAGAGAFETLTEGLCEKGWALFQSYEAAGGLEKALEQGLVQRATAEAETTLRRDVARAKAPLTGVSAHAFLDAAPVAVLPDARDPGALVPLRLAEPFERLRAAAERTAPKVFLAAIGPLSARRLGFARETFAAGGFATIVGSGVAEFRASGAGMACLCGADEDYAAHAESLAAALKAAGAGAVFLAGRPGAREADWRSAGVDGFVYAGADIVAFLEDVGDRAARIRPGLSADPSP